MSNKTNEIPSIVEIIAQKCIGYRNVPNGFVSIIQNVGKDKYGSVWSFKCDNVTSFETHMTSLGYGYDYQRGNVLK